MGTRSSQDTAAPLIPDAPTLAKLREAAGGCRACPLWQGGTRTVFGEQLGAPRGRGPRVMLVGEQPGETEARVGHPFVGPAGRLLDSALETVGIERRQVYVTHAVKHVKWAQSGPGRTHAMPSPGEVRACRPWLEAELYVFRPDILVCLGSTAARALLGDDFRLVHHRGQPILGTPWAPVVLATVHPASILRAPSEALRAAALRAFILDLSEVARLLREEASGVSPGHP